MHQISDVYIKDLVVFVFYPQDFFNVVFQLGLSVELRVGFRLKSLNQYFVHYLVELLNLILTASLGGGLRSRYFYFNVFKEYAFFLMVLLTRRLAGLSGTKGKSFFYTELGSVLGDHRGPLGRVK